MCKDYNEMRRPSKSDPFQIEFQTDPLWLKGSYDGIVKNEPTEEQAPYFPYIEEDESITFGILAKIVIPEEYASGQSRTAVMRKICRVLKTNKLEVLYTGYNFITVPIHSKKARNRLYAMESFLYGTKLRKTAMNNNHKKCW